MCQRYMSSEDGNRVQTNEAARYFTLEELADEEIVGFLLGNVQEI